MIFNIFSADHEIEKVIEAVEIFNDVDNLLNAIVKFDK